MAIGQPATSNSPIIGCINKKYCHSHIWVFWKLYNLFIRQDIGITIPLFALSLVNLTINHFIESNDLQLLPLCVKCKYTNASIFSMCHLSDSQILIYHFSLILDVCDYQTSTKHHIEPLNKINWSGLVIILL